MSHSKDANGPIDSVPGEEEEPVEGIEVYLIGLGLATVLTIVSFFMVKTTLVWAPSIPLALTVLAIAR